MIDLFEPWTDQGAKGPFDARAELDPPPDDLVWNVRAICLVDDRLVLVRTERFGMTIVPGGGRMPGETVDQALRRELMEEAGATVVSCAPLVHIRHESHAPEPHVPHFSHPVVYMSVWRAAVRLDHEPTQPDDGERIAGVDLIDPAEAPAILLPGTEDKPYRRNVERQLAILRYALATR